MSFNILLGLTLAVCLIGIFLRFFFWFSQTIDPTAEQAPLTQRFGKAVSGFFKVLFSAKILQVVQSFFVDLLFQKRIFEKSKFRWLTHGLIFFGFILLFFLHAIGSFTYDLFNREYIPTLNPSQWLRNLLGLLAVIGVGMAIYRRISLRSQRLRSYPSDWAALFFVALIMLSGFLLEGAKISSYATYSSMVEEYGEYDGEEATALEAFWVAENGVHSPNFSGPIDPEMVESGRELNQNSSCVECHANTQSAFVSFSLSGILGPLAAALGDEGVVSFFWILHVGSFLLFLAWLPFSKMFHIVSAPLSLAINRVMGREGDDPVNVLNRQMIGLSACTHCGACTIECSSQTYSQSFENDFILPSEKVQFLKKIASGKAVDQTTLKRLQEGLFVCTSCDRCTDICPSGINLKELFVNSRYALLQRGMIETSIMSHFSFPLALAQKYSDNHLKALKAVHELFRKTFPSLPSLLGPLSLTKNKTVDNDSFKSCYSCQRCTNICPVVQTYDNPGEALDMMPHQIIYSLGIGNAEMALGSRMIWSCSTCYLCQEHCPNKVELTDIFYRLKNIAINRIDTGDKR